MSEQEQNPDHADNLASILRHGFHETPPPGPWHEQVMLRRLRAGEGPFKNARRFMAGSANRNHWQGALLGLVLAAGLGVVLLAWPGDEPVKDGQDYSAEMVLIEKYAEVFADIDEEPQYTAAVVW